MKNGFSEIITSTSGKTLPFVLAILLVMVTIWLYAPGANGPALLDDYSNISVIPDLGENSESAIDYVLGNRSGLLGRPVAMASFVFESLFLDRTVETSKRINIGLHLFNGCLVICLLLLLFRHLSVPGAPVLAVLLGSAWLLTPLYVSTVLYVVQRMAMLSATFMLLSMISYCYWRNAILRGQRHHVWLLLVALFFLLGLFSKENTIVLVPLILLLEALWFEFRGSSGAVVARARFVILAVIAVGAGAVFLVLIFNFDWFAGKFQFRHFTLAERLLTETRVLWDYVAQIYIPDVSRMGIYHDDILVSKSITEPISTIYSIAGWSFVLVVCGFLLRWQYGRYVVFAVAIFLIGHGTESSVFPLELYFEHRNYFPGLGLFLLVGVLVGGIVKKWPQVKAPLYCYLGIYALLLASQTGSQVEIWSNERLMTLNNMVAHPNSFRANTNMAAKMASLGDIAAAHHYSSRAHSLSVSEGRGDYLLRDLALSCEANESVMSDRFEFLTADYPGNLPRSARTLHVLIQMLQEDLCPAFDRLGFADKLAVVFLRPSPGVKGSPDIYFSLAVLENSLQRFDNAYEYIELYRAISPQSKRAMLMKLHFTSALGKLAERNEMIEALQKLDQRGELSVGERRTLALYLER